ncbi:Probable purine permease 10 [Striga hermonthica]|uniref:Probable purine permease n=1 Tax=Striga hermonthica TaxID=68872 RepID=A0A9N7NPH6_STRHE|nr:Probable purine permease 10 [Striga hermonthica]
MLILSNFILILLFLYFQHNDTFSYLLTSAQERVTLPNQAKTKKWWARLIAYSSFVLLGETSATLLGRLYYKKGGKTILLQALLESIGFPILIPFALHSSARHQVITDKPPLNSFFILLAIYASLGFSQAAGGVLYAVGLQNLPVSTFSLLTTTQLGFSALFSYFLNAEKFSFLILNSLVLVSVSSSLLVFRRENAEDGNPRKERFAAGFCCTLAASSLYSLTLSLTQLVFEKVMMKKSENSSSVMNMVMYQSMFGSCMLIAALFASREWWGLREEMKNFEMGELVYLLIVLSVAIGWQVYYIGTVGLIFEVSSLFSNVISTVGLPVVPILAPVFFHERMDGIKVIAILLALWGFVSYVYQNYLMNRKSV